MCLVLISFFTCVDLCTHHSNEDTQLFNHHKDLLRATPVCPPSLRFLVSRMSRKQHHVAYDPSRSPPFTHHGGFQILRTLCLSPVLALMSKVPMNTTVYYFPLLFLIVFSHYRLFPLYSFPPPPLFSPHPNHHTVVRVHESFFFFAPSLDPPNSPLA